MIDRQAYESSGPIRYLQNLFEYSPEMKQTGIRGLFFVLAGLGLVVFSACKQAEPTGPVVAQVGSEKVTLDDLKARLQETPAAYQQYIASAEGRRQFLNLLIREKVLLSEAKTLGIPRRSRLPAGREQI